MLEEGEYVLNRNAVNAIGKQKLDRLNHEQEPRFLQKGGSAEVSHKELRQLRMQGKITQSEYLRRRKVIVAKAKAQANKPKPAPLSSFMPQNNNKVQSKPTVAQELQMKAFDLKNKYRHLVMPKAERKRAEGYLEQARNMSFNPNPNPNPMAEFHNQQELNKESTQRNNQKAIDDRILYEANKQNRHEQAITGALDLSKGKQTYDLARTKLRELGENNAQVKSIFDRDYTDTLGSFQDFTAEPKYVAPLGAKNESERNQARLWAKTATSDDLAMNTNSALKEAVENDRRASRYIKQNDERMNNALDRETESIIADEKHKADMEEWRNQRKLDMEKIPKIELKFFTGNKNLPMTEEAMATQMRQAIESKDYSTLSALAQGFQGSDAVDDGAGLLSVLNMGIVARQAGVPDEEIKAFTAIGDNARVDKFNRNSKPVQADPPPPESKASKILASLGRFGKGLTAKGDGKIDKSKWNLSPVEYASSVMEAKKAEPFKKASIIKAKSGIDRNAPIKVKIGPNQENAVDEGAFADQKADLMRRAGMKLPPTLQKGQEGGLVQHKAVGGLIAGLGTKLAPVGAAISKYGGAAMDFAKERYGASETNKNVLMQQEAEDTIGAMDFGDFKPTEQELSELQNQRMQGLAENDMYGESDDDWDTPDEDKIGVTDKAGLAGLAARNLAGDAVKGAVGTAVGGAGLAAKGIYEGGKALVKGAKGAYDWTTKGKTSFEDFQKTGEGSGWQKAGSLLSKIGTVGLAANEDSPFSSMLGNASAGVSKKGPVSANLNLDKKDKGMKGHVNETPQDVANQMADTKEQIEKITDPLNQDFSEQSMDGKGPLQPEDAPMFDKNNADSVKRRQAEMVKAGLDIGQSGDGGDGVDGAWGPKSEAKWAEYQAMKNSDEMTEDADGRQVYQFGSNYTAHTPAPEKSNVIIDPMTGASHTYNKQKGGFISGIMRYQNGGQV